MTREEFEKRLEAWHRGVGFGITLQDFLGWDREQMQTYVLTGELPE